MTARGFGSKVVDSEVAETGGEWVDDDGNNFAKAVLCASDGGDVSFAHSCVQFGLVTCTVS